MTQAMPADEVLDNLTPQQQAGLDELVGDALADLLLTLLDRDPAAFRYVCTGERGEAEGNADMSTMVDATGAVSAPTAPDNEPTGAPGRKHPTRERPGRQQVSAAPSHAADGTTSAAGPAVAPTGAGPANYPLGGSPR